MLLSETVLVRWNSKNKYHYINKGYFFTKIKDEFEVKIEDLTEYCNSRVLLVCDYCGCSFEKTYKNYLQHRKIIEKDCCDDVKCMKLKRKESNLKIYGVNYCSQLEYFKEKGRQSFYNKTGYYYRMQMPDFMEIVKNTNISKYGKENVSQVKEFKEKYKSTCLVKYGVEYLMQDKNISEEITKKTRITLYKNGTAPCSVQQLYLHKLLGGELNYPVDKCNIDILLNNNIAFEYDGSGHDLRVRCGDITNKEFLIVERKRSIFLQSRGYKRIKFISKKDYLPFDNIVKEIVNFAISYLNSGHNWIEINIDEGFLKSSQFIIDYDFGELRKIIKE